MARKYVRKSKAASVVQAIVQTVARVLPRRREELYRSGRVTRQTLCFNVR